ncbi:MAG: GHMP kinase [Candidatus Aminicenantes bacterium]|nr:GHMP kinase [Candidatus Aminicenantes bacterium]
MIEGVAYARAGLLGNPSDNCFGKILAIAVGDFSARVSLEESDRLAIFSPAEDRDDYASYAEFIERNRLYGYDGGVRLLKALLRVVWGYWRERNIKVPDRNFTLRYGSTIPRQVGLGGSSALITAGLRALMSFSGVGIPVEVQPTLVLNAEQEELGINAGFMDRVIQVYEGCVYMDLDKEFVRAHGHGRYERIDPAFLPLLYLAYRPDAAKISGRVLSGFRSRYDQGDMFVIAAMGRLAELAALGREALIAGRPEKLFDYMNENFNIRRTIMDIRSPDLEMIEAARACGAAAKFAGSGGSIVGMYSGEPMYERLRVELGRLGAVVLKPRIV